MYDIIVLEDRDKLDPVQNYGLINTETNCIEARVPDMPSALAVQYSLMLMLRDKPWESAADGSFNIMNKAFDKPTMQ